MTALTIHHLLFSHMPKRFGMPQTERLKSRKAIDALFAKGKANSSFPVRMVYVLSPATAGSTVQIGVTVSKRNFKRAVDRNRVKRLLREAYRLQKEELISTLKSSNQSGHLFFIYTDRTIADFETIKKAVLKALQRLIKTIPVENPS